MNLAFTCVIRWKILRAKTYLHAYFFYVFSDFSLVWFFFTGKNRKTIVYFSRHRNSFSRPKKTLLVPTHLFIFLCRFLFLTVIGSARMSSHMKKVNFLFWDSSILLLVLLKIFVNCFTGAIGYYEGGYRLPTCISYVQRIGGLSPSPQKTGS